MIFTRFGILASSGIADVGATVFFAGAETTPSNPHAYEYEVGVGYGTKYANPASNTGGTTSTYPSPHPTGDFVAIGSDGAPFVYAYAWSDSTGFGTQFAAPADLSGINFRQNASAYSNDGDAVVFGGSSSSRPAAWAWSAAGFGTRFPSTFATAPQEIRFSPNGDYLATAGQSPIRVYEWSAAGFGSSYIPAVPTGTNGFGCRWNTDESVVAATDNGLHAWEWSAAGFGTKYADPSPGALSSRSVVWNANDEAVLSAGNAAPISLQAWAWSPAGFGTGYANPVATIERNAFGDMEATGQDFVAVNRNNALVEAIPFSTAGGFGTKYANAATNLPGRSRGGQNIRN